MNVNDFVLILKKEGLNISEIKDDINGKDYQGFQAIINFKKVLGRFGKITSSRNGQFVTFYKREGNIIIPFDVNDNIDFYLIYYKTKNYEGVFLFPKNFLLKSNIMTNVKNNILKGKLAFRVCTQLECDSKSKFYKEIQNFFISIKNLDMLKEKLNN